MDIKNLSIDLITFLSNYHEPIILTDEKDNILWSNNKVNEIFEIEQDKNFLDKYKNLNEIFKESNQIKIDNDLFIEEFKANSNSFYYEIKIKANYKILELTKSFFHTQDNIKLSIITIKDLSYYFYAKNIFFEFASDAIFIMDKNILLDCNTKTLKMFGYKKKDEIIGKPPYLFSPPTQFD